jgi:hypothetical protein
VDAPILRVLDGAGDLDDAACGVLGIAERAIIGELRAWVGNSPRMA